jgi:hypothetical protein
MSKIVSENVIHTKKIWRNNKLSNYYLPKNIKNTILNGFNNKLSLQKMIKVVNSLKINKSKNIWSSTVIFIVHQASSRDSLDILDYYIKKIANKKLIVNSTFGTNNFTPVFRAAYLGSIKCLKLLVSCGADINIKNNKNETIFDAIKQGRIDITNKDKEYADFHNDRFDECIEWLCEYKKFLTIKKIKFKITDLSKLKKPKKPIYKNTNKIKKSNNKKFNNIISDDYIINSYFSDKICINDVIQHIVKYHIHNNVNTLIRNWLLITSEKNEKEANSMCKLIHNLILYKIINKDDINIIFNTELVDIIRFDAPFCKKYVHKLYQKHNINLIDL